MNLIKVITVLALFACAFGANAQTSNVDNIVVKKRIELRSQSYTHWDSLGRRFRVSLYPTPVTNVLASNNATNLRNKYVETTSGELYYVDYDGVGKLVKSGASNTLGQRSLSKNGLSENRYRGARFLFDFGSGGGATDSLVFVRLFGDMITDDSNGPATNGSSDLSILTKVKKIDGHEFEFSPSPSWTLDPLLYGFIYDDTQGKVALTYLDTQTIRISNDTIWLGRHPAWGDSKIKLPSSPQLTRDCYWLAHGAGTTTTTTLGLTATTVGSISGASLSTTNSLSSSLRVQFTTTAGANLTAGISAGSVLWRGNGTNLGGFKCVLMACPSSTATGARAFIGLRPTSFSLLATNPSASTNIVGIGLDDSDTNWYLMYNDGSGTATKVFLTNFPATLSSAMIEVTLSCNPNASEISYIVSRLDTKQEVSGTIVTDLPVNTTFLAPTIWYGTGTSTGTVQIACNMLSFQVDY